MVGNIYFIFFNLILHYCMGTSPTVLLVLDGYRHDYLGTYATPNLDRVISHGVLAPRLQPEFPASKLPFLASLLTGVHTQDHGVMAEQVYSEKLDQILTPDESDFWNNTRKFQTIWDVVGQNAYQACNWPHLDVLLNEQDEELMLTNSSTMEERWDECIDSTMRWVDKELNKDNPIKLVSIYLEEPGKTAEIYGPDDLKVQEAVAKVDNFVGKLVDALVQQKLWNDDLVNLIITSTPGYVTVTNDHIVALPNSTLFKAIGESPVLNIRPNSTADLLVYQNMKKAEAEEGHYKVYIPYEIPAEWHYSKSAGVQKILVVANEGYAFAVDFWDRVHKLNKLENRPEDVTNVYGCRGYNNTLDNMQTFVAAKGPDFANTADVMMPQGIGKDVQEPVRVVDIFTLMCEILNLPPPKEAQGDLKRVTFMLRYPSDSKTVKFIRSWLSYALLPENLPVTVALATGGGLLSILICTSLVYLCRGLRKPDSLSTGYRYTQVKNNRRLLASSTDDDLGGVEVQFEGDKQGLLTEVPIGRDEEEEEA